MRKEVQTSHQLTTTEHEYLDAVRALGGVARQRILCPRVRRPPSDGLYDSKTWRRNLNSKCGYR